MQKWLGWEGSTVKVAWRDQRNEPHLPNPQGGSGRPWGGGIGGKGDEARIEAAESGLGWRLPHGGTGESLGQEKSKHGLKGPLGR